MPNFIHLLIPADANAIIHRMASAITQMDGITFFGLIAVSLMLVFYSLEDRSPHFTLAFACSCWMGATYGFLQGAWPFGIVEGIWGFVALRNWLKKLRRAKPD